MQDLMALTGHAEPLEWLDRRRGETQMIDQRMQDRPEEKH